MNYNSNGRMTAGPVINQTTLWLRSTWDFGGKSQYSYSLDGKTFEAFGPIYQLTWGDYRGDRIGLFTFNDQQEAGYVDFDSIHYDVARTTRQATATGR